MEFLVDFESQIPICFSLFNVIIFLYVLLQILLQKPKLAFKTSNGFSLLTSNRAVLQMTSFLLQVLARMAPFVHLHLKGS